MCNSVSGIVEDKMEHRDAKKAENQKAQGLVEYALMLAFVVIVSITLMVSAPGLHNAMNNAFESTAGALEGK